MDTSTSVKTRQQTLQGFQFPFDEKVIEALDSFKQKSLDYLQLVKVKECLSQIILFILFKEIDDEKELIQLSHSEENMTPENIQKSLPANAGRYHIYRFKPDFNDESIGKCPHRYVLITHSSSVFLYSVPGHGVKISQRMIYASCKGSVIDAIEKQYEVTFERKVSLRLVFLRRIL